MKKPISGQAEAGARAKRMRMAKKLVFRHFGLTFAQSRQASQAFAACLLANKTNI
ncbi:MAG TPA: hypothetical protein VG347_20850 [Verrucomicrobiae bacterium]|nr:hypothetical protein [Verrucomicrobiae bacterium]